ncbi:hypothetical protein [Teredinibacter waterburyi]|uniref:hypothetical protein n=1 Tax=Teredinibacter waterburyi TaxID=1500538 RepID=UPI00165F9287|nr:hypothetical protein [Teredinibacter waterburyi]
MEKLKSYALVLVAGIALVAGVQYYRAYAELAQVQADLERMQTHAQTLEQQVVALEQEKLALKEQTVDGIIDHSQKTLRNTWGALIEQFQGEMEKLGEKFEQELEQGFDDDLDSNQKPGGESGKETDNEPI